MHSVFLALGFAAAFAIKRSEERRLGYVARPGFQWVSLGALAGAVLGSKLGMVLYVPWPEFVASLSSGALVSFDGKTVLGGLAGGWLGVEVAKALAGVSGSTGDAFALAIPVGQAIGRLGCFVGGCCYGAPSEVPWAVLHEGIRRHPHPLYEAAADGVIALLVLGLRRRAWPPGHLFRATLLVYALVRIALEPTRGDSPVRWGSVSAPVAFCAVAALALAWSLRASTGASATGVGSTRSANGGQRSSP